MHFVTQRLLEEQLKRIIMIKKFLIVFRYLRDCEIIVLINIYF